MKTHPWKFFVTKIHSFLFLKENNKKITRNTYLLEINIHLLIVLLYNNNRLIRTSGWFCGSRRGKRTRKLDVYQKLYIQWEQTFINMWNNKAGISRFFSFQFPWPICNNKKTIMCTKNQETKWTRTITWPQGSIRHTGAVWSSEPKASFVLMQFQAIECNSKTFNEQNNHGHRATIN